MIVRGAARAKAESQSTVKWLRFVLQASENDKHPCTNYVVVRLELPFTFLGITALNQRRCHRLQRTFQSCPSLTRAAETMS